jgi:cystathionine beta-lyase
MSHSKEHFYKQEIDFDEEHDFDGLISNKWNFRKERVGRDDVIAMWVADMDFETSPAIQKAIVKRAKRGIYGYAAVTEEYTNAVIGWFQKRHQWTIAPESIKQTPGVITAIHLGIQALSELNDFILIQTPVYHPFFRVIKQTKRQVLENPFIRTEKGYEIDFEDFKQKIIEYKPKVFILCNPHNPIGKVYRKEELIKLGEICLQYDVKMIVDEIHCDLVYSAAKHIPFGTLGDAFARNAIICTAPSKSFNLAGIRNSNIIIPDEELRAKFQAVYDFVGIPKPSLFPLVATQAAYEKGEEWFDQVIAYIQQNRDYAIERIEKNLSKLKVNHPEGTYFLWVDFSDYGLTKEELEKFLIDKAGVWFNQGYIFGSQGIGFVRINIACPRKTLKRALKQLEDALNELK